MAGIRTAVDSGKELENLVATIARNLKLEVKQQVRVGHRIWGAQRKIDIVVSHPITKQRIGLECKVQSKPGSAEEKIPATIDDIRHWPMKGLVVFSGNGFSAHMRSYLLSTGLAVEMDDLKDWLKYYFALE